MPIGLIYIGSMLKHHNHEVKILDRNLNPSDNYLMMLLKKGYDFVGVGTFTGPMLFDAIHVSKITKENSNSIVVWGGFHPTIVPEQTLKNEYVDYIVRGEGEEVFLQMVELNDKKKKFSKLKSVNLNPLAKAPDVNKLPFPDYDLVNVKNYDEFYIITSRGCPYRCTFCYNSYGKECAKRYQNLDADKTIQLIEMLTSKYKVRTLTIPDDNFPSDKERLKKIANGISRLGLKFYCFSRANYTDPETLHYLKKAGAWNIQMGIESGSQKMLNFMRKGTTVEMNAAAIKNLRRAGIASEGSFMIGLPTETVDDIKMTYRFIRQNKLDNGGVKIFQPFPKTLLWDYCLERKRIQTPKSTEEWAERYVCGFDKVVFNVSDVQAPLLEKYHYLMNKELQKGVLWGKIFHYLRHRRLPNLNKVRHILNSKFGLK
jgi:radical SAM superfamily enzyme YgiQ (UPF0313 family)